MKPWPNSFKTSQFARKNKWKQLIERVKNRTNENNVCVFVTNIAYNVHKVGRRIQISLEFEVWSQFSYLEFKTQRKNLIKNVVQKLSTATTDARNEQMNDKRYKKRKVKRKRSHEEENDSDPIQWHWYTVLFSFFVIFVTISRGNIFNLVGSLVAVLLVERFLEMFVQIYRTAR